MDIYILRILQTLVVISVFLLLNILLVKLIDKTMSKKLIHPSRGVISKNVVRVIVISITILFSLIIWGVKQSDLILFFGSVLTVVGVAFFAQWSLLSNITSSLIIFFKHPVKLNDQIIIMEAKDYTIEGKVINIDLFFVTLEIEDGSEITLPNNIFILKTIKNLSRKDGTQ